MMSCTTAALLASSFMAASCAAAGAAPATKPTLGATQPLLATLPLPPYELTANARAARRTSAHAESSNAARGCRAWACTRQGKLR